MKYIILVLWTFSLFLLMFSSFPFRVECRPTRAMGPGPPYLPGTGVVSPHQYSSTSQGLRSISRSSASSSNCPVMEGPSSKNQWSALYVTDITAKVWDTPLVLEGIARSRSEIRGDGTYGVTFDLVRVVKGDAPILRRRNLFRLQFLDNPSSSALSPAGNSSSSSQLSAAGGLTCCKGLSSSTALIPTRAGGSGSVTSSRSSTNNNYVNSNSNNNNNNNNHHNYNRALSLRSSSSNSNINRNSQLSSMSSARVSGSGTISLKSSSTNQHSNYVNLHNINSQSQLQQQQQSRRPGVSFSSGNSASGGSRIRNNNNNSNNNNSPLLQTVQFNQQYIRNYHHSANSRVNNNNFTLSSAASGGVGGRSRKNVRIARSHQRRQLQQYGGGGGGSGGGHNNNYDNVNNNRHARHGRVVVGSHNNFVVNSGGSGSSSNSGKCLPPRATVKTGRKYFVFAAKVESHFVAVFSPELANKRNTKSVESILCKNCGQAPSVVAQKEGVLQPKERLRIRCRLKAGNPIPVLTWYKDGRPVNVSDPRFRLRLKRRQSVLVIRRAKEMDVGVYKCEAKNVFGSAHATTRVTLSQKPPQQKPPSPKTVGTTPTTLWAVPSSVCPFDSYCLNGGTCSYYETIGEYVCQCAEGYKGQRCDNKDIPNSGQPGDYASQRMLLLWS